MCLDTEDVPLEVTRYTPGVICPARCNFLPCTCVVAAGYPPSPSLFQGSDYFRRSHAKDLPLNTSDSAQHTERSAIFIIFSNGTEQSTLFGLLATDDSSQSYAMFSAHT